MIWFRRERPPEGPPRPPHIDLEALMGELVGMEARGISSREMAYLRANAPRQSIDKWGQPLPLSTVDQDRLDSAFALLVSPLERGRSLLTSGQLGPDEVSALKATNPEVLQALREQAQLEMVEHGPPFAAWAEAALSYLFEKPAAQYAAEQPEKAGGRNAANPGAPPTPVDRLEVSVRQQTRRQ